MQHGRHFSQGNGLPVPRGGRCGGRRSTCFFSKHGEWQLPAAMATGSSSGIWESPGAALQHNRRQMWEGLRGTQSFGAAQFGEEIGEYKYFVLFALLWRMVSAQERTPQSHCNHHLKMWTQWKEKDWINSLVGKRGHVFYRSDFWLSHCNQLWHSNNLSKSQQQPKQSCIPSYAFILCNFNAHTSGASPLLQTVTRIVTEWGNHLFKNMKQRAGR